MQGDFTDQPENVPELLKRFEGGADIVVGERDLTKLDRSSRRLAKLARLATRPLVAVPNVADPFGTFRLYRISVIRDTLKATGENLLVARDGWSVNLELLLKASRSARRVETVTIESRYDVRLRHSRVHPVPDAMRLFRFGFTARKWQPQAVR
jgi:hypothetical protein